MKMKEFNAKQDNFGRRLTTQEESLDDMKADEEKMDKRIEKSLGDPKAEATAITQKALNVALASLTDRYPYPTSSPIPSSSLADFRG